MVEIKLKPCPFCGGEAEIVRTENYGTGTFRFFAACLVCGVETPRVSRTMTQAAEAWNRRADNKSSRQSCKSCKHYTPDPSYRNGDMGNCRYLEKIWEKPFYVNQARTECDHYSAE